MIKIDRWGKSPIWLLKITNGVEIFNILTSKNKKIWLMFGNLGIIFMLFFMIVSVSFIIHSNLYVGNILKTNCVSFSFPEGVRNWFLIPGVCTYMSFNYGTFWYSLIAFITAIVFHECCHGLVMKAQNVNVNSWGIMIPPIGAFVDENTNDLNKSSFIQKLRIFSAGVMGNFLISGISLIIIMLLATQIEPINNNTYMQFFSPNFIFSKVGILSYVCLPYVSYFSDGLGGSVILLIRENNFIAPYGLLFVFNTMLWMFWINFIMGVFNCLPLAKIDGGLVVREIIYYIKNYKIKKLNNTNIFNKTI